MPLLDGGRRRAAVREAEAAVTQACAQRDTLTLQVRAEVASALARGTAARQNIDTAAAQLRAAQAAADVAEVRYTAGKSTIAELFDARRALVEAQQAQAVAHARVHAATADLYQAMGVESAPKL